MYHKRNLQPTLPPILLHTAAKAVGTPRQSPKRKDAAGQPYPHKRVHPQPHRRQPPLKRRVGPARKLPPQKPPVKLKPLLLAPQTRLHKQLKLPLRRHSLPHRHKKVTLARVPQVLKRTHKLPLKHKHKRRPLQPLHRKVPVGPSQRLLRLRLPRKKKLRLHRNPLVKPKRPKPRGRQQTPLLRRKIKLPVKVCRKVLPNLYCSISRR